MQNPVRMKAFIRNGYLMTFDEAKEYCQTYYDGLAEIYQESENAQIPEFIHERQCWIGTENCQRVFATNYTEWCYSRSKRNVSFLPWKKTKPEYNHVQGTYACVFIKDDAMWHLEPCKTKKTSLCQKLHCGTQSCSGRGRCMEELNLYQCKCFPGFSGPNCETVTHCPKLAPPDDAEVRFVVGSHGPLAFSAVWNFSCIEGFMLNGTSQTTCLPSGLWSHYSFQCVAKTDYPSNLTEACVAAATAGSSILISITVFFIWKHYSAGGACKNFRNTEADYQCLLLEEVERDLENTVL